MKHARAGALDEIEPLLSEIRTIPGLVERTRGVFYRRSQAFLHFHEDPSGMHADIRTGEDFERLRAETASEQAALVALIHSIVG